MFSLLSSYLIEDKFIITIFDFNEGQVHLQLSHNNDDELVQLSLVEPNMKLVLITKVFLMDLIVELNLGSFIIDGLLIIWSFAFQPICVCFSIPIF